ncbi:MAG: hypothetical protein IPJ61_02185 [Tessaracoccus sp.]|uniref:hypothetical protein n=1 Tax=Tessaracoccus sp. TaxID=1971211 RepID=UPI001EBF3182|nr:hypothetical protein [Tessaracoccus sp.]MBK7819900.1 hypothetical protein [Tessaracoccus sp.]
MDVSLILRNAGNVANLSTPLGIALSLAGRGRLRRRAGLIVADNVHLPVTTAGAMTVGSVVLVFRQSLEQAEERTPNLLPHEDAHAWQWAYCLGLPFLPLYFAAAGWSILRTGDRASANHFERQAGLRDGGYRERPRRTVREGINTLLSRGGDGRTAPPGAGRASGAGA